MRFWENRSWIDTLREVIFMDQKLFIRTNVGLSYPLYNKIWEEERVPTEWKEGYLIKLKEKKK